jgi:hypothetical protein
VVDSDPAGGPWPITTQAIRDAADAICPAKHRHNADPTEPACGDCWAKAESGLRAGWRVIAREIGHPPAH